MTTAPATTAQPAPAILLFARGVVAILDLWPALTIAVAEQWGGPESAAKKTWIASSIIDEWEQRTSYLPRAPGSTEPLQVDPKEANDPALDLDDLGDFINQMMSDEFEANIEDGSIDAVSTDIIRLWHDVLDPPGNITPESIVTAFEERVAEARKKGIKASRGADPAEADPADADPADYDDESGSESDEGMDVDEAPQLVSREPKERQEPIVDDDGFTLVQKGRKGQ